MAVIKTDTFAISRWWLKSGLSSVAQSPNLFSKDQLRDTRVQLIAGTNQLTAIKNWMLAARLLENDGHRYKLTRLARRIGEYDQNLENANTWWALHLSLCFSERSEPYPSLFRVLDPVLRDWSKWAAVADRVRVQEQLSGYADKTVNNDLVAVRGVLAGDGPMAELGLLEFREGGEAVRFGSPSVPREAILFGLALAKEDWFPSRISVDFSELTERSLDHFLCTTPEGLREYLRAISRSDRAPGYVTFSEQANLNSVEFGAELRSDRMALALLQEGSASWM